MSKFTGNTLYKTLILQSCDYVRSENIDTYWLVNTTPLNIIKFGIYPSNMRYIDANFTNKVYS